MSQSNGAGPGFQSAQSQGPRVHPSKEHPPSGGSSSQGTGQQPSQMNQTDGPQNLDTSSLSEIVRNAVPNLQKTSTMPELLALNFNGKKVNLTVEVGRRYEMFGIFLLDDANATTVKSLEKEYQRNAEDINMEILIRWLRGSGLKPVTWSTLMNVLGKI